MRTIELLTCFCVVMFAAINDYSIFTFVRASIFPLNSIIEIVVDVYYTLFSRAFYCVFKYTKSTKLKRRKLDKNECTHMNSKRATRTMHLLSLHKANDTHRKQQQNIRKMKKKCLRIGFCRLFCFINM